MTTFTAVVTCGNNVYGVGVRAMGVITAEMTALTVAGSSLHMVRGGAADETAVIYVAEGAAGLMRFTNTAEWRGYGYVTAVTAIIGSS